MTTTNFTNYEYYTRDCTVYTNQIWPTAFAPPAAEKPRSYEFGIHNYGERLFLAIVNFASSWRIFDKCKYCRKKPKVFVSELSQDFALCEHHAKVYLLEHEMKGSKILDFRNYYYITDYELVLDGL